MKICKACKTNKCTSQGGGKLKLFCKSCLSKPWSRYKGKECECCGFKPVHPCQLDVDHIDGNKSNNDPANYQTLCANCHRLKTHLNSDYMSKDGGEVELSAPQLSLAI